MSDQSTQLKKCSKCGEFKSLDRFFPHWRNRANKQASCKDCAAERLGRYFRTPKGAATSAWCHILSRAGNRNGKNPSYATVEVRISRADFIAWAIPAYERFSHEFPGVTPSVDRIDTTGHYETGNLQLLPWGENSRKKRTARNAIAPAGTLWCGSCKAYLPIEDFYLLKKRTRRNPYGTIGRCKPCRRRICKESRQRCKKNVPPLTPRECVPLVDQGQLFSEEAAP